MKSYDTQIRFHIPVKLGYVHTVSDSERSVTETVPERASVHTRKATFGTISAPEQDYFAPFLKDEVSATLRSTCSCLHCT